jgi:hypothetical protein
MHNEFFLIFLDAAFLPLHLIPATEISGGESTTFYKKAAGGKTLRLANLSDRCHFQAAPIIHVDGLKADLSRPAAVAEHKSNAAIPNPANRQSKSSPR